MVLHRGHAFERGLANATGCQTSCRRGVSVSTQSLCLGDLCGPRRSECRSAVRRSDLVTECSKIASLISCPCISRSIGEHHSGVLAKLVDCSTNWNVLNACHAKRPAAQAAPPRGLLGTTHRDLGRNRGGHAGGTVAGLPRPKATSIPCGARHSRDQSVVDLEQESRTRPIAMEARA